jgi:putative phosphoribosyl transferase
MSLFHNREEAGQKLSLLLSAYKGQTNSLVLGLARGGVVIAFEIAKALQLPLNVLVPRKLGAPANPELAIGAISDDGEVRLNPEIVQLTGASPAFIREEVAREKQVIQERLLRYHKIAPIPNLAGKTILLVDDGVATGATLLAEIQALRKKNVASLVVAVPVAAADAWKVIQSMADKAFCYRVEEHFWGISSFYDQFDQVEDATVEALLRQRV